MRRHIAVLVCIVLVGFVHAGAYAGGIDGYVFGNGGSGGKADAASGGIEGGLLLPREDSKLGYLLGVGLSGIDRADNDDRGIWSTEYSDEWEGYFAFGVRPVIKNLYLVGSVGGSIREVSDTFNYKGTKIEGFESDEENEFHFTTSGQVRYVWKHLMVGAGYHNRRGVIGGIGFVW